MVLRHPTSIRSKRPRRGWGALLCTLWVALTTAGPAAADDLFLMVSGISGDSTDAAHVGWSDALFWSWAAFTATTIPAGGPVTLGPNHFDVLSVSKVIDSASPEYLIHLANATKVDVVLVQRATGGTNDKVRIELSDAYITGMAGSGRAGDAFPSEQVLFTFSAICIEFTKPPPAGPPTKRCWDVVQDTQITP